MLNLQQAIDLATKAHEGQWRKPIPGLDDATYWNKGIHKWLDTEFDSTKQNNSIVIEGIKINWNCVSRTLNTQKPYITHPLAIMNMMEAEEKKIVAVLHDTIEDTSATLDHYTPNYGPWEFYILYNNKQYFITEHIYTSLKALTHLDNESYDDYIDRIVSSNKTAIKVKIADICHNLSDNPSSHQKVKYLEALPRLLSTL